MTSQSATALHEALAFLRELEPGRREARPRPARASAVAGPPPGNRLDSSGRRNRSMTTPHYDVTPRTG